MDKQLCQGGSSTGGAISGDYLVTLISTGTFQAQFDWYAYPYVFNLSYGAKTNGSGGLVSESNLTRYPTFFRLYDVMLSTDGVYYNRRYRECAYRRGCYGPALYSMDYMNNFALNNDVQYGHGASDDYFYGIIDGNVSKADPLTGEIIWIGERWDPDLECCSVKNAWGTTSNKCIRNGTCAVGLCPGVKCAKLPPESCGGCAPDEPMEDFVLSENRLLYMRENDLVLRNKDDGAIDGVIPNFAKKRPVIMEHGGVPYVLGIWSSNITYITANDNCANGILDGDEEDVDCGGSCPDSCALSDMELLEMYSPVLYMHPDEKFYPMSINSMTAWSNLSKWSTYSGNYTGFFIEILKGWPLVSVNDLVDRDSQTFLDMVNAKPGFIDYQVPNTSDFFTSFPDKPLFPLTVYGRVERNFLGYIVLQYWFFYPYNDGNNKHEGDWEMIQILLDSNTENVINATYSWHNSGTTFRWGDIYKVNGTHPKVFVSLGGHASYNKTESPYSPFEKVSGSGRVLHYTNVSVQEIHNDKDQYHINIMSDQILWINFLGRWGEVISSSDTLSLNGISSPGRKPNWMDPISFAINPRVSRVTTRTGSPVNLHAYDLEGRHIGLDDTGDVEMEIPGAYLFIPSDNNRELIDILTEEDLQFIIESTGEGEFNLSVYRYNKNTSMEIELDFNEIPIIEETIVYLDIAIINPSFVMLIDYDGNDVIDSTKLPENFICEGNCTFEEIDSDFDGFSDSIDNCPDEWNPNQFDNESDGVGDVCDPDDDNDNILDVNDECPFTNPGDLDVDTNGCVDNIYDLLDLIRSLNLQEGIENSLISKVGNAIKSLEKGNREVYRNQLNALVNEVEAQRGRKISEKSSKILVSYIRNMLTL